MKNFNLKSVYHGIMMRCTCVTHPRFKDYGGRGISVCDEWRNSFSAFESWANANGYKPGLQLDRIDNNRPYAPNNCRFVTPSENAKNRRNTIRVTIGGVDMCLKDACLKLGAPYRLVHHRIHDFGWSVVDALTRPVRSHATA